MAIPETQNFIWTSVKPSEARFLTVLVQRQPGADKRQVEGNYATQSPVAVTLAEEYRETTTGRQQ